MTQQDSVFTGSIPQIYDSHLVPLIFQAYADDLAERMGSREPSSVLETAAGSGVVTRAAARRLDPGARYTVTDLNPAMLEHARSRQRDDARFSWQPADALELPFPDDSFDIVLCQFGVMFFPDRIKGFAEARRVLKPGGLFLFNTWDRIEENHFAEEVTRAAGTLFPDDPPLFLARTPHGYHDPDQIRSDVEAAGFSGVRIAALERASAAASPDIPAIAYTQGTPLRNEIEARDANLLTEATEAATAAIRVRFGDGSVEGRIHAFVVEADA